MKSLPRNEVIDLEIELSTLCQASCPLCYRNYKVFDTVYTKNIQRDLFDVIADLETFPNLKWIRLVGSVSEPTLYKSFLPLVKYIKSRDINIEICTNGDTNDVTFWKELASALDNKDKVYFTICGSTQEIHEIYRKNTKLKNILRNAEALRSIRKIDYAQCIRFSYNDKDFPNILEMVSDFTHIYETETFLKKEASNYKDKSKLLDLAPNPTKLKSYSVIEKLANQRLEDHHYHKSSVACKAYEDKSQIMDVYGKVYPCYLFMEAMNGIAWDGDYEKIFNLSYDCCKYCEKGIRRLLNNSDLTYII